MSIDTAWIQTYTGVAIQPLNPRTEDIRIEDIAHALSNQCRFSGHCREFYSVAQHSIAVASLLAVQYPDDPVLKLWGLLHDASEAYLVDIPRPIKYGGVMGRLYREHEAVVMRAICDRFGLPALEPAAVKWADNVMLLTEQRDLMGRAPKPWKDNGVRPLAAVIEPWGPYHVETLFLRHFNATMEAWK